MRCLAVALITMLFIAIPAPPALAQSAPCQYILGFATLHALDTADTGNCLDNQVFAANGDAQQHTTNGLMAWRKADNWTAFTNGYWTWINGPNGLAKRLNTQRYSWEANPDGLPLAGGSDPFPNTAAPAPDTVGDQSFLAALVPASATIGGVHFTRLSAKIDFMSGPIVALNVSFDDANGIGAAVASISSADGNAFLLPIIAAAGKHWPSATEVLVTLVGQPHLYQELPTNFIPHWDKLTYSTSPSGWLVTYVYALGSYLPADGPTLDGWGRPTTVGGTVCSDGWVSSSTGSGTCSHHGGEASTH
jgi:hypothetical protein